MVRKVKFVIAAVLGLSATVAIAEGSVWAFGETQEAAMVAADAKAAQQAQRLRTCIAFYAAPSGCKQGEDGRWMCVAKYSRNRGSCGDGWGPELKSLLRKAADYCEAHPGECTAAAAAL